MKLNLPMVASFQATAVLACVVACGTAGESEPADPAEMPTTPAPEPRVGTAGDNSANNPILSLDIEPGHELTYYEPAPGYLIMVESSDHQHALVTAKLDSRDPVQVFNKVRPGVQVPEVLLQAMERARSFDPGAGSIAEGAYHTGENVPSTELLPRVAAPSDGVGSIAQAHSQSNAQDFVANHGGCAWASVFMFCRVNWANGFHSGTRTSNAMTGVVDHFAGSGISVRVGANLVQPTFAQSVGTVVNYTTSFSMGSASRFLEVFNAAGDSFHASARWE